MPERTPRRLEAAALWDHALRLLAARSHSTGELREKLLRRAERPEDVGPVLLRLKEYGYLDDRRFAESYSAARLENQGFGKSRVLSDLRKKRVAPKVAEEAVRGVYSGADEAKLVEDYLRRKYRGKPLETWLAEPKNLAGAYRRLRAAGFTPSNSIRVLKRFAAEPELLDSLEDGGDQDDSTN
jgi:regulatory protein